MSFPPTPASIKSVSHFLKVADEHDHRNIVISYFCRLYAVQHAMKILPGAKPPDVTALLIAIMDWLEKTKTEQKDNEGITNDTCGQAIIEEYAIKLFNYAEGQDKNEKFDKNMVKAFYTSGILFDTLEQFGPLSEDIEDKRKYAKWRAAYVHNCLKSGQTPTPGSTTVLYTDEDQEEYKDFLSKEDLDRLKGRVPGNDGAVPPVTPATPSTPNQGGTNLWPAQFPNQPFVSDDIPQPQPTPAAVPFTPITPAAGNNTPPTLTPAQMEKAQKYCKWASSALNYDDVKTAVENLQKALHLLQVGKEL